MLLLFRKTQTIVIFFINIGNINLYTLFIYILITSHILIMPEWSFYRLKTTSVFYSQLDILRRVLFNKYYWWPFFIWQVWSAFVKQQGFALCTKTITLNNGIFFQNCRPRRLLIGWHFFVIKVLAGLKGAELSLYLFLFCCVKRLKIIGWFRLQNP